MFMDNSASSVSTNSYYSPEHDDRSRSTADFQPFSEPRDGYYSVPDAIDLIQSLSSGWCKTRKRSSSSPLLDQDIFQTINISRILQEIMGRNKDRRIVDEENKYRKKFTGGGDIRKQMKKNKKKDMRFKNLSEFINLKSSTYVCKICHHKFDDFRALGGHIAAHNRNKKVEEAALVEEQEQEQLILNIKEKEKKYPCDLCSRTFSTGQALGGHKTYHRKVGDFADTLAGSDSQVTCDEENISVLKFDLNAPPDEGLWGA